MNRQVQTRTRTCIDEYGPCDENAMKGRIFQKEERKKKKKEGSDCIMFSKIQNKISTPIYTLRLLNLPTDVGKSGIERGSR